MPRASVAMTVAAKVGARSSIRIAYRRSCFIVLQCSCRGVKHEISEYLQPQPAGALGRAVSEEQRHLLAVLVAEFARIEAQKPSIESF